MHIQTYAGIIQAYTETSVTLAYSELWYIQIQGIFKTRGIFKTLVYSKLWHIQNHRHIDNPELFRTLGYSEPGAYSEPCQTFAMERFDKQLTNIIIFASYSYFRNINFSCLVVHEINNFFNEGPIFTPEKISGPGSRGRGPWYLIYLLEVLQ